MSNDAQTYVDRFKQVSTARVAGVLAEFKIRGQCSGVRAVAAGNGKVCGRAFTIQFLPCGAPDGRTPNGQIAEYLEDVPAGYVVAIDNRGDLHHSVWDDAMSERAKKRSLAGVVIDGASGAGASGYPVFSRAASAQSGQDQVRAEAFNLPIAIGGVRVECDDILLGDEEGLVVIPRDYIARVWAAVDALQAKG